jgi:phosphatidylglycerol:prolipoprotein diacylglycerol transferase
MPITVRDFSYGIGGLELTGFGLAVVAAFVLAQIICVRELERRGHPAEAGVIPDAVMAAVLGTIVGAKTYYVILTGDPGAFLSRGGFVYWGGFIGAVIACWIVIRAKKGNFLRIADVAGIAIAGGYAVGRTGCWAVGDDYGRPWNGPLAVIFPDGHPPTTAGVMSRAFGIEFPPDIASSELIPVHPTQLYEVGMGLVMFLVLWRLRNHRHAEGWLLGAYCVLAGIERFIVEFFRAKDDRFFGGLTMAQLIALAICAVGIGIMRWRRATGPGRPGVLAATPQG